MSLYASNLTPSHLLTMFKKEKRVATYNLTQLKHVYFIFVHMIGHENFGKGQGKDFTYFQLYLLIN